MHQGTFSAVHRAGITTGTVASSKQKGKGCGAQEAPRQVTCLGRLGLAGNSSLWAMFPRHQVVNVPTVGSDSASGNGVSGM